MPGMLGDSDFDPLKPADSDSVKFGASWIRDIKTRLKAFTSVLFNTETGVVKESVIRQDSLIDGPAGIEGTWNKVKVNSKGLVIEGGFDSTQQVAQYYRAFFLPGGYVRKFPGGGNYHYDTSTGAVSGNGSVDTIYRGDGTYSGSGAPFDNAGGYGVSNANYSQFVFSPPAGVRRVKATIIGSGGTAKSKSDFSLFYGGGGGEMVETTFPLDGSGTQSLTIIVGDNSEFDGCPSRVLLSNTVYADAGCGKGPGMTAGEPTSGGAVIAGKASSDLGVIRSNGFAGALNYSGLSGSAALAFGYGDAANNFGMVMLEWVQ